MAYLDTLTLVPPLQIWKMVFISDDVWIRERRFCTQLGRRRCVKYMNDFQVLAVKYKPLYEMKSTFITGCIKILRLKYFDSELPNEVI